MRRHVILSMNEAILCATWVAHTWVYDRFERTPRLRISSPRPECGKSTLVEVIKETCRRPLSAENISAAAVYRVVECLRPTTLLLDEVDTFLPENEPLRGVLNSGFARDGRVIRVEERNGQQEPVEYATFSAVALSGIGKIPPTLTGRSVPIELQRKLACEKTERLRENKNRQRLREIASKLARWAADSAESLSSDPPIPEALSDRQGDISTPLLAVADAAGGDWPEIVRAALIEVFGGDAKHEQLDLPVALLRDIRAIFLASPADVSMPSAELCRRLVGLDGAPWAEFSNGRPITPFKLSTLLRPFKLVPGFVGTEQARMRGYRRKQFENVWARYLPAQGSQGVQGVQNGRKSTVSRQNQGVQFASAAHPENLQKMAENCHSEHPEHPESGKARAETPDEAACGLGQEEVAAPHTEPSWRQIRPEEVFGPGRRFRMNVGTGQQEVFEPEADAEGEL
jgi:hypothetical protein